MAGQKILLTGYGPFREVKENVTERIISEITEEWNSIHELEALVMPVEWSAAEKILEETIKLFEPDIVISMGHAENYPQITLEARFHNIAEREDNSGKMRPGGIIKKDGQQSYISNIDLSGLAEHLNGLKIPTMVHDGKEGMVYLCNFAGYLCAYHSQGSGRKKYKHLFIHVPSPKDLDYPITLSAIRETIKYFVGTG